MSQTQRHRLLQGYPMLPAMPRRRLGARELAALATTDDSRPLIIGILPHNTCAPRVEGCGFCTFPHERGGRRHMAKVTRAVISELDHVTRAVPGLTRRRVDGVYFGGGTANLTPAEPFAALCRALRERFDLGGAEVTLEGVPAFFQREDEALIRALLELLRPRHARLSMGVQTFDPTWLQRMGRERFGDRLTIAGVVRRAHRRGMTTSADILINLPAQGPAAIEADLRAAIELGFDQICVYHLVLHAGMRTGWARDPAMLDALPDNDRAFAQWRGARAFLLANGYVQTTLTNFERRDVAATQRRFLYEDCSFRPGVYDGLGLGPSGISTFQRGDAGIKWVNEDASPRYVKAIGERGAAVTRAFRYDALGQQLLRLTRALPRLEIDVSLTAGFEEETALVIEQGLLTRDGQHLRPTPKGMFYADSIAGLFARNHVPRRMSASHAHMG